MMLDLISDICFFLRRVSRKITAAEQRDTTHNMDCSSVYPCLHHLALRDPKLYCQTCYVLSTVTVLQNFKSALFEDSVFFYIIVSKRTLLFSLSTFVDRLDIL